MLFVKSALPRYGIASDGDHYCAIYRQGLEFKEQWFTDEASCLATIPTNSELIYAIPHQHIWRKILFLGEQYRQKDLLPQIIQILKQELPLPVEELSFDYQIQNLHNGVRLALFALRNTFSSALQSKQAIWDCELHCIARALLHLNHHPIEDIEQFYFPFNEQFFYFQTDGLHFSSKALSEKILSAETFEVTGNKKQLYLRALGASLWNGKASI